MIKYSIISKKEFIELLSNKIGNKQLINIYYDGWEDSKYFKSLCDEDGGVIKDHIDFIKTKMFKAHRLLKKEEVLKVILQYQFDPYLTSINGNYKYHYDIHIFWGSNYVIYNSFYNYLYTSKRFKILNFIGLIKSSPWYNELP